LNSAIGYFIIVPLVCLFWFDNLGECFSKEPKRSLWLLIPVFVLFGLGFLTSFTPQYLEQRALMVLLYNFVLATITLDLMLCNMAKRHFTVFQLPLLYLVLPLLTNYLGFDHEFNALFFKVMLAGAAFHFYARMIIVCK